MFKVRRMTLARIQARFPQLAQCVGCISPFIRLFDRHSACVVGDGACIRIRSRTPLKSFHKGAKYWTAFIYPDHVSVHASSTVQAAGPIGTWSVEKSTRRKFDLFDFQIFLFAIRKQLKRQAPLHKSGTKKPSSCRPAKPSSRSLPSRAPRVPTSSGTP